MRGKRKTKFNIHCNESIFHLISVFQLNIYGCKCEGRFSLIIGVFISLSSFIYKHTQTHTLGYISHEIFNEHEIFTYYIDFSVFFPFV